MDFSAWNWASHFRLHEAACLIAGVMPVSQRQPTSEELPPQARPPLIKLVGAYYEWRSQTKNPERPTGIVLEGFLNEDGSLPPSPTLAAVTGEIVSREAIHKFLALLAEHGFTSCYDFGPIGKAGSPFGISHQPQSVLEPQAAAPALVADSASNPPTSDFSVLATRDQLIDAFGRFTGMDASWFNNLKDTPALQTARKIAGQGGRGHIAEPWFCPFEVMQWLASSKRRKGRTLSPGKAWELLEKHFPKVYNARSIADPRADD